VFYDRIGCFCHDGPVPCLMRRGFFMEIQNMKNLRLMLAVTALAASTAGCETTRSWCGRNEQCYSPCPPIAASPCNTCGVPPTYMDSYMAPPSVEVLPGPVVN
jgi:hypothetical protein